VFCYSPEGGEFTDFFIKDLESVDVSFLSLPSRFFRLTRQKECSLVVPNKRLITLLDGKSGSALWVAPEKTPLSMIRCLFGITKLRASRLDWRFFRCNSDKNERQQTLCN